VSGDIIKHLKAHEEEGQSNIQIKAATPENNAIIRFMTILLLNMNHTFVQKRYVCKWFQTFIQSCQLL